MNYEGPYRCWIVICKSRGCGQTLFLDVVGPPIEFRFAVLPPFASFKITCPDCETENFYGPPDVEEQTLSDPPTDYRCQDFLDAIRVAAEVRLPDPSCEIALEPGSEAIASTPTDLQPTVDFERAKRRIEISGSHFNFGRNVEARKKYYAGLQEAVRVLTDAGYKVTRESRGYKIESIH